MNWLFPSLRDYRRDWLRGDMLAGLTVWAVLVPEALAYASIAGVSPVIGLYAAPGALIFYAALGSSRQLIVGPMSAPAALSAAILLVGALSLAIILGLRRVAPVVRGSLVAELPGIAAVKLLHLNHHAVGRPLSSSVGRPNGSRRLPVSEPPRCLRCAD